MISVVHFVSFCSHLDGSSVSLFVLLSVSVFSSIFNVELWTASFFPLSVRQSIPSLHLFPSAFLLGGYEDDEDNGETFTYTGSGGRDLSGNKRTAEQSHDQTFEKSNLAIAVNCAAKVRG